MADIGNRNLLYVGKMAIVLPVSSTLPKDGFKPAPSEWAFFCPIFPEEKKKPAINVDAGFPAFSLPSGLDFCAQIMILKRRLVYMQSNMKKTKEKPAGLITAGLNPVLGEWRRQFPY
jgi:hypothetical protein